MNTKIPALIASLMDVVSNYALTLSMSKQLQISINRIINQLYLLSTVYHQFSNDNKQIIDVQLLSVQKKIVQNIKDQSSFFGRLTNWQSNNITSIQQIWRVVFSLNQPECQHLISDIEKAKNFQAKLTNKS